MSEQVNSEYPNGDRSQVDVWDKVDALRRMGGKPQRLKMMINIFLEESEGYLLRLQAAFDSDSMDELRSASHALKGALGSLGATSTYHLAQAIEQHALNDDLAVAKPLWPDFVQQFTQLKQLLSAELAQAEEPVIQLSKNELEVLLKQFNQSLKKGDYLAPGEINALRSHVKGLEVEGAITRLIEQMADFNIVEAAVTLTAIADMQGITL